MNNRQIAEEVAVRYNVKLIGNNPQAYQALINALLEGMTLAMADMVLPLGTLSAIASSEINYNIQYFYDAGFTVKLGDELNGFTATSPLCDDFQEVADWLVEQVKIKYPDSDFAKAWH